MTGATITATGRSRPEIRADAAKSRDIFALGLYQDRADTGPVLRVACRLPVECHLRDEGRQ
jgi:hypothetical protein